MLLWLWPRLVAAIAPTGPLAREPPYAVGAAPNKQNKTQTKTQKKKKKKKKKKNQKPTVFDTMAQG